MFFVSDANTFEWGAPDGSVPPSIIAIWADGVAHTAIPIAWAWTTGTRGSAASWSNNPEIFASVLGANGHYPDNLYDTVVAQANPSLPDTSFLGNMLRGVPDANVEIWVNRGSLPGTLGIQTGFYRCVVTATAGNTTPQISNVISITG